jgi:hypothetical protein
MNEPILYKYMSRDTGRIVLENRTLRWSTPRSLNDPYDVQFDLQVDMDRDAVRAAALAKMWDAFYGEGDFVPGNQFGVVIQVLRKIFPKLPREEFDREFGEAIDEGLSRLERALPEIQSDIRRIMANSKLLCLTESPDNKLMWAHYAEQNQGLVLGFRSVPELNSPYQQARPVEYLEDVPHLVNNEFLADMAAGLVSLDTKTVVDRLIYTKSSDWAYEREHRIDAGAGRDVDAPFEDVPFNAPELGVIVVGCQMPDADRANITAVARQRFPHAELLQAQPAKHRFEFEIVPL